MKVLVTRPEPDGETFAAMLRARGHTAISCPVMAIAFRDEVLDLGGAGALAFTSANGVRAFAQVNEERALPVFAVGPATAEAARDAGFAQVDSADGDVESLARLITAAQKKQGLKADVLHIAGSSRAGDLAKLLGEAAVNSRRAVLYDARELDALPLDAIEAIKGSPADWAVFFSARTAKIFSRLADEAELTSVLAKVRTACLSAAVADALNEGHWASVHLAKDRSAEAMISLMEDHI